MRTLILVSSISSLMLAAAPAALADSGNPAARASGESAGASVEATATLASAGITVTAASVVAVAGSTAGVLTGDPDLVEGALNFAAGVASAPFDGQPLEVTDAIIVADTAPSVPFETPDAP